METTIVGTNSEYVGAEAVGYSWSTYRSHAGNVTGGATGSRFLQYAIDPVAAWTKLHRAICTFDTSTLLDDCIISSVVFKFYIIQDAFNEGAYNSGFNTSHLGVQLTLASPNSYTILASSDYQQVGSTKLASEKAFTSLTNNAWNEISLNATGLSNINKSGYTCIGMRFGSDVDNVDPTVSPVGNAAVTIYTDYYTSLSPRLVVTWTYPDVLGFRYRRAGVTYKCGSSDYDPGGARLKFRKAGAYKYMPLVDTTDSNASYFRVRYGGVTMAAIHID